MRTWYEYRSIFYFHTTPIIGNSSFRFCEDRKCFDKRGCSKFWKTEAPLSRKQFMIETEETRKYKV